MAHVRYKGVVTGRVPLRPGETREQAVERAEETLNLLTARAARRLEVEVTLLADTDQEAA